MTQKEMSVITEALDGISSHIRDIEAVFSSTADAAERRRLRTLIGRLFNLETQNNLLVLLGEKQAVYRRPLGRNETPQDDNKSMSGKPSGKTPHMRTFDNMFACVPESYVKPPRPLGTGQDDMSFGLSGHHLP